MLTNSEGARADTSLPPSAHVPSPDRDLARVFRLITLAAFDTRKHAASVLGVTTRTFDRWRNGYARIPLAAWVRLAQACTEADRRTQSRIRALERQRAELPQHAGKALAIAAELRRQRREPPNP